MKLCNTCNTKNHDDAFFCTHCNCEIPDAKPPIPIDLSKPLTPRTWSLENLLRLNRESRESILYRVEADVYGNITVGGTDGAQYATPVNAVRLNASHRVIYCKNTTVPSKFAASSSSDARYNDDDYGYVDYAEKDFAPSIPYVFGDTVILTGNGFSFTFKNHTDANLFYAAMLLSDYYQKNGIEMYMAKRFNSPAFVPSEEVRRIYNNFAAFKLTGSDSIGFDANEINRKNLLLTNLVFKIYDGYNDVLAEGFLAGVYCTGSIPNENSNYIYNSMPTNARIINEVPKLIFNQEDAYSLKYCKATFMADLFEFYVFMCDESRLYGDPKTLTLYLKGYTHGIYVYEFKCADLCQYYALGEWLTMCLYYCAGVKSPINSGQYAPLKLEEVAQFGMPPNIITPKMLQYAGIDKERLNYYIKAFGVANIPAHVKNGTVYVNYKYCANEMKFYSAYSQTSDTKKWRELSKTTPAIGKINNIIFDVWNLTVNEGQGTCNFNGRSPLEYNLNSYILYNYFYEKRDVIPAYDDYEEFDEYDDYDDEDEEDFDYLLDDDAHPQTDESQKKEGSQEQNDEKDGAQDGVSQLNAILEELNSLTGLDCVKSEVNKLKNFALVQKKRVEKGLKPVATSNHLVFTGNPGTGKTTVARIIGKLYNALGILPTSNVVEVDRQSLVAEYVGQTAPKTAKVIEKAMNGVLFIDEAYSLAPPDSGNDFGKEAIDTLLKAMEDHRDKIVVIAVGYKKEMNRFIKSNPGLESRFPTFIHFEDYNGAQMYKILDGMCKKDGMVIDPDAVDKIKKLLDRVYQMRGNTFANGRTVRNIYEAAVGAQMTRIAEVMESTDDITGDMLTTLTAQDFGITDEANTLSDAKNELNSMTGLEAVKRQINDLTDLLEIQAEREKQGVATQKPSLHMVFTGNPGTGKTTVARIIAKIYKDLGLLTQGHLVEADRSALVAGYSGQTAIKTAELVELAKGGVLFIDEAYTLNGGQGDTFGQEAIDTLLKLMEDNRGNLAVIVAGYNDEMRGFIDSNPGLSSRFNRYVHFDDYTDDELLSIFKANCKRENYTLDPEAEQTLLEVFAKADKSTFGNGRGARNLFELAKQRQATRLKRDGHTPENINVITKEDIV